MTIWFTVFYMGLTLVNTTYIGDMASCQRDAREYVETVRRESGITVTAVCRAR